MFDDGVVVLERCADEKEEKKKIDGVAERISPLIPLLAGGLGVGMELHRIESRLRPATRFLRRRNNVVLPKTKAA